MSRVDMASAPAATIGSVVELDSLLRQLATGTLSETNVATSRLLDAAREEFVAHGIARTAVGDIARRAGVSRPTLYRKCGDKGRHCRGCLGKGNNGILRPRASSARAAVQCGRPDDRSIRHGDARSATTVGGGAERIRLESFSRNVFDVNTAGYQGLLAVIAELLSDDSYPVPAVKRALDLALRLTSTFLVNPSDLLPTDTDTNTREFAIRYLLPLMRAAR